MILIADTGPVVAALNADDRSHKACAELLNRYRGPIVLPAPVVTEIAFLLQSRLGTEGEACFLDALARGELAVEDLTTQDYRRMAALVRQYAGFPLGTADAAVIAVAERLRSTHIATIDMRHFRAVVPQHCPAFTLLPADG